MIELLEDRYVKALTTACLEVALNQPARVIPGQNISFGDKSLALDAHSQVAIRFPAKDDLKYIPLHDFLDTARRFDVKDKVVIVGLDLERYRNVETPLGKLSPHRAFYYVLMSLYRLVSAR